MSSIFPAFLQFLAHLHIELSHFLPHAVRDHIKVALSQMVDLALFTTGLILHAQQKGKVGLLTQMLSAIYLGHCPAFCPPFHQSRRRVDANLTRDCSFHHPKGLRHVSAVRSDQRLPSQFETIVQRVATTRPSLTSAAPRAALTAAFLQTTTR